LLISLGCDCRFLPCLLEAEIAVLFNQINNLSR